MAAEVAGYEDAGFAGAHDEGSLFVSGLLVSVDEEQPPGCPGAGQDQEGDQQQDGERGSWYKELFGEVELGQEEDDSHAVPFEQPRVFFYAGLRPDDHVYLACPEEGCDRDSEAEAGTGHLLPVAA